MKIEINGVEYELDEQKALNSGSLKLARVPVLDIKPCDVFGPLDKENRHRSVIVVRVQDNEDYWMLMQIDFNPLSPFSSKGLNESLTKVEAITYLNKNRLILKKNISNEIEKIARD